MFALQVYRSPARYSAARLVSHRVPGALTAGLAPLRLVKASAPALPAADWARIRPRLSGICGSDLALLSGKASTYFSALVSFPFTPGHELVGDLLDDVGDLAAGTRVVLDPALTCRARHLPECAACRAGFRELCSGVASGDLAPGMQTGYCADTGGAWAGMLVAHRSQIHAVRDDLPDRAAMLIEPFACALHGVERGLSATRDSTSVGAVLVAGAGTLGLLTILALRVLGWEGEIIAVGRHSHQRDRALAFGASLAVSPDMAISAARRLSRSPRLDPSWGSPFLLGGVDVAFECAGTPSALDLAMRTTRGGGRVVLVGMPAAGVDLAPLWFRELEVIGAYAAAGGFHAALNFSSRVADQLDGLVSATYPLVRWREAIDHALDAGRLGDARIAFDPRAN